jgi:3-hydroxyacyl-CoA dehydrogenase
MATLAAAMRRIDRLVVRRGPGAGGIGLRVMAALRAAADLLVEQGATPARVDGALRGFGFAAGPYEAADAAGLTPDWAERQRRAALGLAVPEGGDLADLLVESGRLGGESGRGFFRHEAGSATDDPEVAALLAALREAKGIVPRVVGRDEIVHRCLAAAANEGARLLGEGVALRPGDIDAALVAGFDFPRWEGGPMAWAAARGLIVLRAELRRFAPEAPVLWQVAPLIDALIREGRTLGDLEAD